MPVRKPKSRRKSSMQMRMNADRAGAVIARALGERRRQRQENQAQVLQSLFGGALLANAPAPVANQALPALGEYDRFDPAPNIDRDLALLRILINRGCTVNDILVDNFNPAQARLPKGVPGGGRWVGKGAVGGVVGGLKAIWGLAGKIEHAAHSAVSDLVGAAVSKLPEPVQDVLEGAWKAYFAAWNAGQELVERVARERGLSASEAKALRATLAGWDARVFGWTKAATVAGVHAAHLPFAVSSVVPVASVGYVAAATTTDFWATARAARDLVKDAVRKTKSLFYRETAKRGAAVQKAALAVEELPARNRARDDADEERPRMRHSEQETEEAANLIADALTAHNWDEWYRAILCAAIDATRNLHEAINLADDVYAEHPEDTSEPREDDIEAFFGFGQLDDEPTDNAEVGGMTDEQRKGVLAAFKPQLTEEEYAQLESLDDVMLEAILAAAFAGKEKKEKPAANWNPAQPRVPKGMVGGGQWVSAGAAGIVKGILRSIFGRVLGSVFGSKSQAASPAPADSQSTGATTAGEPEPPPGSLAATEVTYDAVARSRATAVFSKEMAAEDLTRLVGVSDDLGPSLVEVASHGPSGLEVVVRNANFVMRRRFTRLPDGEVICQNLYIRVKDTGKGLGTKIFSDQVEALEKAGINRIMNTAERGAKYNGYYTWPRLGWDAPIPEDFKPSFLGGLLGGGPKLPAKYAGANTLRELYAMEGGADWWKQNGISRTMEFDTRAGSASRQVLDAYKAKAAAKAPKANMATNANGPDKSDWRTEEIPEKGEEITLTSEDEAILDEVWKELREKNPAKDNEGSESK